MVEGGVHPVVDRETGRKKREIVIIIINIIAWSLECANLFDNPLRSRAG